MRAAGAASSRAEGKKPDIAAEPKAEGKNAGQKGAGMTPEAKLEIEAEGKGKWKAEGKTLEPTVEIGLEEKKEKEKEKDKVVIHEGYDVLRLNKVPSWKKRFFVDTHPRGNLYLFSDTRSSRNKDPCCILQSICPFSFPCVFPFPFSFPTEHDSVENCSHRQHEPRIHNIAAH